MTRVTDKTLRTDWIHASTRPVHVGYYEVRYDENDFEGRIRYWDGDVWRVDRRYPECLFGNPHKAMIGPFEAWRGLASDPNA